MSEVSPTELRIYCLCGQKMKVNSSMFGKPGKCVACRQKIRIPSVDELPENGREIHLKDHPEFLRKPRHEAAAPPEAKEDDFSDIEKEIVLLAGDEEVEELSAVPFVIYEPLRALCNYEHQVERQLQALRKNKKTKFDKATLMSYRGLARKSRHHLEKRIRDELGEIADELDQNRQTLDNTLAALRSGETGYITYSKAVLPLRKRREVLIYRQHNLRGWLATEDPHTAGGLQEVDLGDVPVESTDEPFPLESEIDSLPIENAVLKLEGALRAREKADKRLNELHHMHLRGSIDADSLKEGRAGAEAARERSRGGVAFFRSRLEQVVQDCEDDSSALKAYQEVKKGELDRAALAKDVYQDIEESIFRAQVDIKRARNMATRALNANAVSDVPNPRGTFLERLARPGSFRGIGVDSWLAWLGSALMLTVIFVPITNNTPGGNAAVFQFFTLALFAGAAVLGLSATILVRLPRALVLSVLWLGLTIGGAAYFEHEINSEGMAGAALRTGGPWWSAPGGILLLAGWAVAGLGAIVSSFPVAAIRWVGPVAVALGCGLAAVILTGYGGFLAPQPVLLAPETGADPATGQYSVEVTVRNQGRRPFWLGGVRGGVPAPAEFTVQRQIGPDTWQPAEGPAAVTGSDAGAVLNPQRGLRIPGGGTATLQYRLPPGVYRVSLTPAWAEAGPRRHTFELDSFDVDLGAFFTPPPDAGATETPDNTPRAGEGATVELKGVVVGGDSQPKFSIIVTLPDGTESREQYGIGDTIWGDWTISEFSPAYNTITVTNGDELIIVERGEPETLR